MAKVSLRVVALPLAAGLLTGVSASVAPKAVSPADALACTALAGQTIDNTRITVAEAVAPTPDWRPPEGALASTSIVRQPFCRIGGKIDGRIGFELWLPVRGAWNGRLLGTGVGGSGGYLNYPEMARGVHRGFASSSTDTGHGMASNQWMLDPVSRQDYIDRAQHRLAQVTKQVVARFYGRASSHNYFIGCSGGGRQAMKEVQSYPADYDGVIAGAAGMDMPELSARHLWVGLLRDQGPAVFPSRAQWSRVSRAAIASCDARDGVIDGVIDDPRVCRFDPGTLACAVAPGADCLTPRQLDTVRRVSAPIVDENGRAIDQGLAAGAMPRPGPPPPAAAELFGQGGYGRSDWDPATFRIGRDLAQVQRVMPDMRADDPDIRPFARRGGKLIVYHGWLDGSVLPQSSISWTEAAKARLGTARALRTMRLYMVPGMLHCTGGDGPDQFGAASGVSPATASDDPRRDLLTALVRWVERGAEPGTLVAARVRDGLVDRTRPLCPYPQRAVYRGKGDTDRAENFRCTVPRPPS